MEVSVLGAGTMGSGIAQVAAMAGHQVRIRDIEQEYVTKGLERIEENLAGGVERDKFSRETADETIDRITGSTEPSDALEGANLVIEAVPEDLELKKEMFRLIESNVDEQTIIASNTSTLPVTALAAELDQPDRAIGMHFFNPVHIMEPVELVIAEQTSDETVEFSRNFADNIGKSIIEVNDSPGFATSRLGAALGNEAMRMVEEGVADPADIDRAMSLGYNHPVGPLKLTDMNGLDVRLDALEHLREELGERFKPPQVLKRKVQAGKYGKKTGEGFYIWEDGEAISPQDYEERD